jgi:DNA polymerase/3'-5' exonuclease PolX
MIGSDETDRLNLISSFKELAELYGLKKDKYRQGAFETVITILSYQTGPIPTGQALREIPGIGESSAKIIEEWLETGKIKRLEELKAEISAPPGPSSQNISKSEEEIEKEHALALFGKIHGVGPKAAEKWYNLGWRTLEDVEKNQGQLTNAQKVGLRNLSDLMEKIPRSEIDLFQEYLKILLSNVTFMICGSYRRGLEESGDIDVLLMETEGYTLGYIVDEMIKRNLIVDKIALGPTKFMGMIRLGPEYRSRRLDLRWVNRESWSFATLYFTGNYQLNIRMRQKAISMGLTLSEYGLVDKDGIPTKCQSEECIFMALGMTYLEPNQRSEIL